MKSIGYYPGCSLSGTAFEFDRSVKAVAARLGVELREVPDWVCCGATSAHAIDREAAVGLAADTLAKAWRAHLKEILAPCAMCYQRLASVSQELAHDPALSADLVDAMGDPADTRPGDVQVCNVVDWLCRIPEAEWPGLVKRPLAGLKVACYYGCLLVRPPKVTGLKNCETPRTMERIVSLTGATPVRWTMALECCGGSFSLSRTEVVVRQGTLICQAAREAKADVLILGCPMCQNNLDMRQAEFEGAASALPILYISQLVGLAFGASAADMGLETHFVQTGDVIEAAARRNAS